MLLNRSEYSHHVYFIHFPNKYRIMDVTLRKNQVHQKYALQSTMLMGNLILDICTIKLSLHYVIDIVLPLQMLYLAGRQ